MASKHIDGATKPLASAVNAACGRGRVCKTLRSLLRDSSGNVTMMLGLSALPMVAVVGAGIDYARITADRAAFQSAIDSALVSVVNSNRASFTGLTQAQIDERVALLTAQAMSFIKANYQAAPSVEKSIAVNLSVTDSNITVSASHTLPTSLMGIVGTQALNETLTSTVNKAPRPVEMALVMDTTGSMSGTPMTQAKAAAHKLLATLYNDSSIYSSANPTVSKPDSPYVRVSLVPFTAAVRLDTNAYDYNPSWIDTTGASSVSKLNFSNTSLNNYTAWGIMKDKATGSPLAWNGCVESRPGTYATSDDAPAGGDSLFVPYFAPDEPTFSSSSSYGYYNSYISTSGSPNELAGWTSTSPYYTTSSALGSSYNGTTTASGGSAANSAILLARQNNVNKYNGASISAESYSSSSGQSYGPWWDCDMTKIVPMTYNRVKVEAAIEGMIAAGATVVPEGLAWGWRTLSPTEPLTKVESGPSQAATMISPYHDARWRKIMVLMTDGQNDVLSNGSSPNPLNGSWYSSYGRVTASTGNRFGTTNPSQANAKLDSNMLTLCANVKATGIEIFTIYYDSGSGINSTQASNLKSCATDASHYTTATPATIGAVFSNIAQNTVSNTIYLSK